MRTRYLALLLILLPACSGDPNEPSQPDPVQFTAVDAGSGHACALTATGAAYCWGSNGSGQLGTTASETCGEGMPMPCSSRPWPVGGTLRFMQVSAGSGHTCAITTDSLAYCWGFNGNGELGAGAASGGTPLPPSPVSGGHKFKWIDAGVEHSCGVNAAGVALCWGRGSWGQLGDGSSADHTVLNPTAVQGSLTFVSITAGGRQTCALATGGVAYCWGEHTGNDTFPQSSIPRRVSGSRVYATLNTQWLHVCGVTDAAEAYCWGDNFLGMLGDSSFTGSAVPVRVHGALSFSQASAGSQHSCGLTTGGAAYCWGQTDFGQLGNGIMGATADEPAPVAVLGGYTYSLITSGGLFSCALTVASRVYCWGDNGASQLGDGTTVSTAAPVLVLGQL